MKDPLYLPEISENIWLNISDTEVLTFNKIYLSDMSLSQLFLSQDFGY